MLSPRINVACPTRTPATSVIALSGPIGIDPIVMPRSRARGRVNSRARRSASVCMTCAPQLSMRNPKAGRKPSKSQKKQKAPGVEREMRPRADHGEKSYRGCGKLQGLAAIITGGDSGIGRAVAIAFAREGADVGIGYFAAKEEEDAKETVRWIEQAGRSAIRQRINLQRSADCTHFVDRVVKRFGRLDILVN